MNELLKRTADMIFEKGAFKLELHNENANAPFSINLKKKVYHKEGLLEAKDFNLIAQCLFNFICNKHLLFNGIAAIPWTGEFITREIMDIASKLNNLRLVFLNKIEMAQETLIVPVPNFSYFIGHKVLLINDSIIKGNMEIKAIDALLCVEQEIIGIVVFIDYKQGAKEKIGEIGYSVHSIFTINQLLDYYYKSGKIGKGEYIKCIDYLLLS
ncbi:hypothetical protein KAI92_03135 [Candidatus Parcubacteria bacterium]|nr:hypothetical protein [Candidatus Parcubacteria bacterium]